LRRNASNRRLVHTSFITLGTKVAALLYYGEVKWHK